MARSFAKNEGIEVIKTASIPQPISPFRWMNLIEDRSFVYQGYVDFLKRGLNNPMEGSSFIDRISGRYDPPDRVRYRSWKKGIESPMVKRAMEKEGMRTFFWFARFPVVMGLEGESYANPLEFFDLRFYINDDLVPFVYFVEFDENGGIKRMGFADDALGFRKIRGHERSKQRR